ncbi:hypothetical protein DCC24_00530 [Auritidibacter sp. NML100628]|nr:hypothetical protein DCC24_00530 [Auritidibacter sp. NML100628]
MPLTVREVTLAVRSEATLTKPSATRLLTISSSHGKWITRIRRLQMSMQMGWSVSQILAMIQRPRKCTGTMSGTCATLSVITTPSSLSHRKRSPNKWWLIPASAIQKGMPSSLVSHYAYDTDYSQANALGFFFGPVLRYEHQKLRNDRHGARAGHSARQGRHMTDNHESHNDPYGGWATGSSQPTDAPGDSYRAYSTPPPWGYPQQEPSTVANGQSVYPPIGQPIYYAPFNTMAIVGFVFSLLIPIVGVICSHISLSQIKKTGERGRGLALAGAIIGWVIIGLGVGFLLFMFISFLAAVATL